MDRLRNHPLRLFLILLQNSRFPAIDASHSADKHAVFISSAQIVTSDCCDYRGTHSQNLIVIW